jgi:hypothetical protein
MKKTIISAICLLAMFSCGPTREEMEQEKQNQTNVINPVNSKGISLIKIASYETADGTLHIYKFGNDTVYWAVGNSAQYPVSIQIK